MDKVEQWMDVFGLAYPEPDMELTGLYFELIQEEYLEFKYATQAEPRACIIREAGDLIWTIKYYLFKMGVDPSEVESRIFDSNMTKLVNGKPVFNAAGKVQKGPHYMAPRMDDL